MNTDKFGLLRQSKEVYGAEYQSHLLEQYKLYVDMADRISARRMLANSFFVGLQTALIGTFTLLLNGTVAVSASVAWIPSLVGILLCFAWWSTIRSYGQLNTGKYQIVHCLEQMLPVAPYDAEWTALGRGKDKRLYWPLSDVERWVPVFFAVIYVLLALAVMYGF